MPATPPLNGLRAFEAAARHMSFKKAADELCVTHGAVSRHIRNLEDYFGVQLFTRRNRRVELTSAGAKYMSEISDPFRRIYEATANVMSDAKKNTIKLCVPPTFAIRWLVPRLARFQAKFPDVSLQISTPFHPGFRQDADMAVCYGMPDPRPGIVHERLFDEILLPVVSPALAESAGALRTVDDLAQWTLLHSMIRLRDWPAWLRVAGAHGVDPDSGLKFENSGLVYQALSEGLGVAMGQFAFVADDIDAGRLSAPFDTAIRNGTGYFLLRPEGSVRNPNFAAFHAWIREEVEALPQHSLKKVQVIQGYPA
jgi:LysR family glycine cleavage system transcriptional activator